MNRCSTNLPLKEQMKLLTWTANAYPEEVCGVVCGTRARPVVFRLPNVAEEPETTFQVAPEDLAAVVDAHGMPIGVWHSHPGGKREPSHTDIVNHPAGWDMIIVTLEEVLAYRA